MKVYLTLLEATVVFVKIFVTDIFLDDVLVAVFINVNVMGLLVVADTIIFSYDQYLFI